jgi:hypothetical protein
VVRIAVARGAELMVTAMARNGWNGAGGRRRRITQARAADLRCGGVGSMRSRLVVAADGLKVEERERVRERGRPGLAFGIKWLLLVHDLKQWKFQPLPKGKYIGVV